MAVGKDHDGLVLLGVAVFAVAVVVGAAVATARFLTPEAQPEAGSADSAPTVSAAADEEPSAAGTYVRVPDVVADECLLSRAEARRLLDLPVLPPERSTIRSPEIRNSATCYITTPKDLFVGKIDVYGVQTTTAENLLRDRHTGNARPLPDLGRAAFVSSSQDGETLRIATKRYLIVLSLDGVAPTVQEWMAAGQAAVAAVQGRE